MAADLDIDAYFRRYGPMVHRRCLQLLRDEQRAADAMQDTFVQLVRRSSSLQARSPAALLNTIATRICLNLLRDQPPETVDDERLRTIASIHSLDSQVSAARVVDLLLGREHVTTRTIAVLHYLDGMTLAETAQEVGLSISAVRKRLDRFQARVTRFQRNDDA